MQFLFGRSRGRPRAPWPAVPRFDRELVTGWLLISGFAALGAALALPLQAPLHGCLIDTGYPQATSQADVNMRVREGMACAVLVRTGSAVVSDLRIVAGPVLGTVSQRGRTGVIYRAGRTFHGDDTFAFELRGRDAQHDFTSLVHVAVTVE
jgi:hypothetical protein